MRSIFYFYMPEKIPRPSIEDLPPGPRPMPMETPKKEEPPVPLDDETIDEIQRDILRKTILPPKTDEKDSKHWN